jgi:hypothetical protein
MHIPSLPDALPPRGSAILEEEKQLIAFLVEDNKGRLQRRIDAYEDTKSFPHALELERNGASGEDVDAWIEGRRAEAVEMLASVKAEKREAERVEAIIAKKVAEVEATRK